MRLDPQTLKIYTFYIFQQILTISNNVQKVLVGFVGAFLNGFVNFVVSI